MGVHKHPEYKKKNATLPKSRYVAQKAHAKACGIPFTLTFDDWWALWEASRQWENQGKQVGQYCMTRKNDQGSYDLGNVEIAQVQANLKEQVASGQHVPVKLTDEQMTGMVGLELAGHRQREIAAHDGVSQSEVSRILTDKRGRL